MSRRHLVKDTESLKVLLFKGKYKELYIKVHQQPFFKIFFINFQFLSKYVRPP